jgi:hypothetical protein
MRRDMLTAEFARPASVVAARRSRIRRVLAPVALFVGAAAALAGFTAGTVMTRTPVTVPGQPLTGVHSSLGEVGPMPGDLDSGRDAPVLSVPTNTVVTTSL